MFPKSWCRNLFRHGLEQLREGALQQRIASRCRSGMSVPKYTASLWNRQLRAISDPLAREWLHTRSGGAGTAGAVQKSTFPYYNTEFPALGFSLEWESEMGRRPHGLQCLWTLKNWYPKSWGSRCTLTQFWTLKVSHWCDRLFCFVYPEILHDWEILHLRVLVLMLCWHL